MKDLEGETLTTEDIAHKLNINFEEAQVLAAAPELLAALEESLAIAHSRLGHAAPGYYTCISEHCIQAYGVIKRARAKS